MKRFLSAAFIALSLSLAVVTPTLTGCSLFGVQRPQGFDQQVVAGYKSVETAADLVAALNAAGKLDQAGANAALDRVQQASDGIGVAVGLHGAGDFSNADTRLAATIAALELLLSELRAKQ